MNERLGILISGGGTTAEAIIMACQEGRLDLRPVVVISSRENAGGIEKARVLGVETRVVNPGDYGAGKKFGEELLAVLEECKVEIVSQNGWMPLTPGNVVEKYERRIVNQHPGPLDPGRGEDFGGKGMYGARVSCARVACEWVTGEKNPWTEATIHRVTREYDKGGLIWATRVEFEGYGKRVTMAELANNPERLMEATKALQERLLPVEHETVIAGLAMMARGERGQGKRETVLVLEENWETLRQAKELAIRLFPNG